MLLAVEDSLDSIVDTTEVRRLDPVSYTHLDVYKRQDWYCVVTYWCCLKY